MMQLVHETRALPPAQQGACVALGNFDGVHKGHQVVLGMARQKAQAMKRPCAVITFEPHPRSILFPTQEPYRITPPPVKRRLLRECGVDLLFEIPFTQDFSLHSADDFIAHVLLKDLAIAHAIAGHDFVFGHKRSGNMVLLKEKLFSHHVGVTEVAAQNDADGTLWSSTRIRASLQEGDMKKAALMLGRYWEIEGVVVRGEQRGRTIGFATANIDLGQAIRPLYGVYAVRVHVGGGVHGGVANIGTRPTVNGHKDGLEVHLFDFSGDLYDASARVEMLHFIRPERRFSGLEALRGQIALDCTAARDILARL